MYLLNETQYSPCAEMWIFIISAHGMLGTFTYKGYNAVVFVHLKVEFFFPVQGLQLLELHIIGRLVVMLQVRIYTAEKVHMQLEDAFHHYTQASVGISTRGKLLVPKLLQCYAQNFVEDSDLLDWICNLLPSSQVDIICECIQQRHHHVFGSSNITIVPFNFTFRYLFHVDIVRTLMSLWWCSWFLKKRTEIYYVRIRASFQ